MTTDEWVTAASMDDAMVVELLLRLKHSSKSFASQRPPPLSPPLGWGHHQPRSKQAATRKELESTRCSPTTPLSWSCGDAASPSDGCDESSRPSNLFSGGRSKGVFTNEIAATTTTHKRSRRKKTFSELKEEESLLLKERIHLKKNLATLRMTFKEQKAKNENLKRIKLDLQLHSANKMISKTEDLEAVNSSQLNLEEASTLDHVPVLPSITMHGDCPAPASCKVEEEVELETRERCFILPDLNMMASEEDSGSETIYGLS